MGELFLSHDTFYAPNGYGAVHIGKKRRRISMMPMEKVRQFTKPRETLIKSLSDFTLKFLCMARNNLTRIASYLRKAMTKPCIKILVEADSAI